MNTSEKAEITTLIHHIEVISKSMLIWNAEVPNATGRKNKKKDIGNCKALWLSRCKCLLVGEFCEKKSKKNKTGADENVVGTQKQLYRSISHSSSADITKKREVLASKHLLKPWDI